MQKIDVKFGLVADMFWKTIFKLKRYYGQFHVKFTPPHVFFNFVLKGHIFIHNFFKFAKMKKN